MFDVDAMQNTVVAFVMSVIAAAFIVLFVVLFWAAIIHPFIAPPEGYKAKFKGLFK